jgi:hypothetical protein
MGRSSSAGLLSWHFVGPDLTARCGDARSAPPCPKSKSLAAEPFRIFRQSLSDINIPEFQKLTSGRAHDDGEVRAIMRKLKWCGVLAKMGGVVLGRRLTGLGFVGRGFTTNRSLRWSFG